jgi:hypothetical protein
MTKVRVVARIRPFLPLEKVDDVISMEEATLLVKDLRFPGVVTKYPFVVLLQREPFSSPRFLTETSPLVMITPARIRPSLRSKSSPFLALCSRVLYDHSARLIPMDSFHLLEDCIRLLLWR